MGFSNRTNRAKIIRDWAVVICYTALIYSTLSLTPNLWNWLRGCIGGFIEYLPAILLAIAGALILFYLIFRYKNKCVLRFACLILVGLAYVFGLQRVPLSIEKIHFIEYGLLSLFVFKALRHSFTDTAVYILTVFIVFCIGWMDEMIQYFLPNRVYDFKDVLLNGFSSALGLCVVRLLR
jgi:hypothetical protein